MSTEKTEKQKSKQVNVKLSPDVYKKLETVARKDCRPVANLIAKIIYSYLETID